MKSSLLFATIFTMATVVLSINVEAKPMYFNSLLATYPQSQVSKLRCTNCHSSGGLQLNAFGKDFARLKAGLDISELPKVWLSLEQLDSDMDSVKNIDELMAGTNPGK